MRMTTCAPDKDNLTGRMVAFTDKGQFPHQPQYFEKHVKQYCSGDYKGHWEEEGEYKWFVGDKVKSGTIGIVKHHLDEFVLFVDTVDGQAMMVLIRDVEISEGITEIDESTAKEIHVIDDGEVKEIIAYEQSGVWFVKQGDMYIPAKRIKPSLFYKNKLDVGVAIPHFKVLLAYPHFGIQFDDYSSESNQGLLYIKKNGVLEFVIDLNFNEVIFFEESLSPTYLRNAMNTLFFALKKDSVARVKDSKLVVVQK